MYTVIMCLLVRCRFAILYTLVTHSARTLLSAGATGTVSVEVGEKLSGTSAPAWRRSTSLMALKSSCGVFMPLKTLPAGESDRCDT
jgi:hypothetical protein